MIGRVPWNKGKKVGIPSWNSGKIKKDTRICLLCNNAFITESYQKKVYCSRVCSNRHRVALGFHHWYKGGVTPLNFAVRSSIEYQRWRKSILERDGFRCQLCDSESKTGSFKLMHVDHIVPLSFLLKENGIKSIEEAKTCEKLFDLKNGRVLCIDCHKQTDTFLTRALAYNK